MIVMKDVESSRTRLSAVFDLIQYCTFSAGLEPMGQHRPEACCRSVFVSSVGSSGCVLTQVMVMGRLQLKLFRIFSLCSCHIQLTPLMRCSSHGSFLPAQAEV